MKQGKRVFALGFFDGVHRGHQELVRRCCALARELDCKAAAVTFDSHPQALTLGKAPILINSVQDRKILLRRFGIGPIYTIPFDRETMSMPWQAFFRMLLEDYGAIGIVCGDDFRFGHRGQGNARLLQEACAREGIPCIVVPEQSICGVRISSTHIRSLMAQGNMDEAVEFLGHPHILTGVVVSGRRLGRTLGFPTANVLLPEGVIHPKSGVYATKVRVADRVFQAVTNVGNRPTVQGHQTRTESWLLDFDGDLYGEEITISFHSFLRPEMQFGSLEELKQAVAEDADHTRTFFEGMDS